MNIEELIKMAESLNLQKVNENEDILEIKSIIPTLEGYKEHLCMWLDDEPENAKEQGAEDIINAIDIVINGIENID